MRTRLARLAVVLVIAAGAAVAGEAPPRVLVVTESKGFTHNCVARPKDGGLSLVERTMQKLGESSGMFTCECTQDASTITAEKLAGFSATVFYTCGEIPIGDGLPALLDWIRGGKGFVGFHSATDCLKSRKPYIDMIGGSFAGHPWGTVMDVVLRNHDPAHPLTSMYPAEFPYYDETYRYRDPPAADTRVLISMAMEKSKPTGSYHVPITWIRPYGEGRVFYSNMGHGNKRWDDPVFHQHILAAMGWALRRTTVDMTPNPAVSAAEEAIAYAAAVADAVAFVRAQAAASGQDPATLAARVEAMAKDDAVAFRKFAGAVFSFRVQELSRAPIAAKRPLTEQEGEGMRKRAAEAMALLGTPGK